ncbi:tail sheath [Pseudomonas phage Noxifer]|uniref:Tail sheath protein n=1 Tax=Pseudomonas phage Noxifer TaxID=2006684 RepID=A0A1Y0SUK5_9CAUD|nr:tail sheath [Pseudomonas phage Noxifer]ARV77192.1 tail sheath protein [Pseudomonas phage Noxifer]
MSNVNSTPRIVYGGFNDKSRGTATRAPVTYPQHAPLLRLWGQTGTDKTVYLGNENSDFNSMFGSETLARRGKFFNLQSLLAETLLGAGNGFFVKRLIPEDAKKSRMIIGLELVRDLIPAVQERLSGFNYNGQINPGQTAQLPPIDGYKGRVVLMPATGAVGTAEPVPGTLLSEVDGTQSTIYPLFELPASYFGAAGNNLGIRMWAPNEKTNEVWDEETATAFKTRMFRMQFMQKVANTNIPAIVLTAMGEDYVDVCFTEGAYSASTDKEFYIGDVLIKAFEDDGIKSGLAPLTSPFSEIHVYSDQVKAVQDMIYARELAVNPAIEQHIEQSSQIDFLTGMGMDGDVYQSLYLLGALNGGIVLNDGTTVYATGGEDGTINHAKYEELVTVENTAFGQLGDLYENDALYPFSHIYDTGLSMDGKIAMMNVLGQRRDLKCVFTTYVEAEGRYPTLSEELSRGQVIMTRLKAYPESTLYGTGICRAEVVYQTGELMDGGYSKKVPQIIDYAFKLANFAGSGDGILRDGADPDQDPNNEVSLVKNLNVPYFPARAQSTAWDSGGIYSLTADTRVQYYPCVRSVYQDETSVLLSPITTSIACDIVRLIRRIHKKFAGNAKISPEQLIERSNKEITKLVEGRYAGRVRIIPETYLTPDDKNNGFTWHCKVKLYANNPRTTMFFELETYRMDALAAAA